MCIFRKIATNWKDKSGFQTAFIGWAGIYSRSFVGTYEVLVFAFPRTSQEMYSQTIDSIVEKSPFISMASIFDNEQTNLKVFIHLSLIDIHLPKQISNWCNKNLILDNKKIIDLKDISELTMAKYSMVTYISFIK